MSNEGDSVPIGTGWSALKVGADRWYLFQNVRGGLSLVAHGSMDAILAAKRLLNNEALVSLAAERGAHCSLDRIAAIRRGES